MITLHPLISKRLANTTLSYSFEVQLSAVKERLEAAKAGSTRGLQGANGSTIGGASFAGLGGARIAKPLRGGGAALGGSDHPIVPTLAALQNQENGANKRSSWFFNQRS